MGTQNASPKSSSEENATPQAGGRSSAAGPNLPGGNSRPNLGELGIDLAFQSLQDAQFVEALVQNNPVAIVNLDLENRVLDCNPAFERLFGYTCSEVIGEPLDQLITDEASINEASQYTRQATTGQVVKATGQRTRKDGSHVMVEIQGIPVIVEGEQVGLLTLYQDISDRLRAESQLHNFYKSFVTIMDSIDADVYVSDMDTYDILFMNQHMKNSFGGDLVGRTCWKVFRGSEGPCEHCTNDRLLDDNNLPVGEIVWEGQNPITKSWYKNSDRAIQWNDGRFVRLQIATDITELKKAETRLKHLATHDTLTDLPNRSLFQDRLKHSIALRERGSGTFAVMFLDLDNFKAVNDAYGHENGDILLQIVAERLRNCFRGSDTIARLSGDEFAFLMENVETKVQAATVAAKIQQVIAEPFIIDGALIHISASVGVSLYPVDGQDADLLLRRADEAMYLVKHGGKNGYKFYNTELD